ncbi:MAG: flagellar hook-length control protein FliK, partial [Suilimivivens sp.]
TPASTTTTSQEIMDQILDYMKIQLKPEMEQLEMQLHPESLGTLHVQLTSKGGEVTAQFQVQNESVKAAIESQISILKDTLREQGVKVEAVEVTVESHAFESNLWQGQEREEGNAYQGSRKSPRRINLNVLEEGFEEEADEEELLAAEIMKANGGTVDYTA